MHLLSGYGSTAEELASLRMFKDGLMKVNGSNPPLITTPQGIRVFALGDPRGNSLTPLMAVQIILV